MRIGLTSIFVPDQAAAREFYTDVLGFKVRARERIERSSLGVPLELAYLDLGGTSIELIKYGGPVAPAPTSHRAPPRTASASRSRRRPGPRR